MADAFSLAVNIFTLLECGRKFVTLALDVHKNGKDAVSRIISLNLINEDLSKIGGELSQTRPSSKFHNQDQTDGRIYQLATRCTKVAGHMQQTIEWLGMHRVNRKAGSAVMTAFKYKWKQSDIVAFQSEIEDLRSELMLNLILWLRSGMMKSLDNQDKMVQKLSELRSHDEGLTKRLDDLSFQQEGFVQQIVEILSSHATARVRSNDYNRPQTSLEADLMDAVQNAPQAMGDEDVERLQLPLTRLGRVRKQFIHMFRYESMFEREDTVAKAHPDTLKWVFKYPSGEAHTPWTCDNFCQWLESEDQLYWITGKVGTGKSTIMKYISEELPTTSEAGRERRCTPYLLRWAKDRPLFIATFYFWANSTEDTRIQTSAEGLYRTLLTQILEAYPKAAPRVSSQRWENLCLFNKNSNTPGVTELKIMVTKAIEYVSSVAKVCLFIDGLDEFEGDNDNLYGLITWMKDLPIKLCVSGRESDIILTALLDQPRLQMQHINFEDIQQYVQRTFYDDPNFTAKSRVDSAFCDQLLDEIVSKSEGIFLWVEIVCRRLIQAMLRGGLLGDLRKILNELPVDLYKLYSHILDNLDLQDQAARYFLLLQAFSGRPDALLFSFADDIGEDSEFSLKMPKKALMDTELQYRVTELGKRLNSRCGGLLSLSMGPVDSETPSRSDIGTVKYCFGSAKDYLTMDSTQRKLIGMLDAPFDPHLRLCSAHLARWKCYASDNFGSERHTSIYNCAEHARKVATENHDSMIRVLDNLDPDFEAQFYMDDSHFGRYPWFGLNLLSLTVVLRVSEYAKRKIRQGQGCMVRCSLVRMARPGLADYEIGAGGSERSPNKQWEKKWENIGLMEKFLEANRGQKLEWPLLLDALLSRSQPDPEMVSLLLENGADPNLIVRCAQREESALDAVLYYASRKTLREDTDRDSQLPDAKKAWVDSLCLLLRYGAKPHRSDVQFIRKFIGEDVIHAMKLPHLGCHRDFVSRLLAYSGLGS